MGQGSADEVGQNQLRAEKAGTGGMEGDFARLPAQEGRQLCVVVQSII